MAIDRSREMSTPPSIFDVARIAGVSPSTVSRSLRGMPHVAPATRERVLEVARELSYVASPAAKGLASGRTTTIGMVMPFVGRWFFMRVVEGAMSVLREADYDVLIYSLDDAAGRERFFDRLPLHRKVDGVLMVDVTVQPDEQAQLQALGIPVTLVGGDALGVGRVRIDNRLGVRLALQHLRQMGHSQVGLLSGHPERGLDLEVPDVRRQAFHDVAQELGMDVHDDWVVIDDWGQQGGARAMERLLSARDMPSAIFAESDEIAFGALHVLRRAGLSVPGRVSVVGFDDHPMASVVDLTTIAQPVPELGATAASLLLDALSGDGDPFAEVVLPTRLRVRGSTGAPATL